MYWVRNHIRSQLRHKGTLVGFNGVDKDRCDLALWSYCEYFVCSIGSFGWMLLFLVSSG